jgi:type I restriction enzyme R subunit
LNTTRCSSPCRWKNRPQIQSGGGDFQPLNIACVFSPPAQLLAEDKDNQNDKNVADIKQLQEDLPQEKGR